MPPIPLARTPAPESAAPDGPVEQAESDKPATKRNLRAPLLALAAVLVLGSGGFFAYQTFMAPASEPPPIAATPKAAPAASAPAASTPAANPVPPGPTPSETLNALAHAPANAIRKAKGVVDARAKSGQTQVDPEADDPLAQKPAAPASLEGSTVSRSVAPGLTATTEIEAAGDASPEFRSFVANTKVTGVFQGTPPRAFINGRLHRPGDTVDAGLGVIFVTVEVAKKQLIFKDRSGAIVARKY